MVQRVRELIRRRDPLLIHAGNHRLGMVASAKIVVHVLHGAAHQSVHVFRQQKQTGGGVLRHGGRTS